MLRKINIFKKVFEKILKFKIVDSKKRKSNEVAADSSGLKYSRVLKSHHYGLRTKMFDGQTSRALVTN